MRSESTNLDSVSLWRALEEVGIRYVEHGGAEAVLCDHEEEQVLDGLGVVLPELAEVICQRDRALATLIEQIGVEEVREILAYYERFGLGGFGPQANRRDELDDINLNDLLG